MTIINFFLLFFSLRACVSGTADHLARGEDLCLSRKSVSTSPSASAGTDGRTSVQAFAPDGVPLCLYCLEPVELANLGTAWDARFCSYDCKEEHQVLMLFDKDSYTGLPWLTRVHERFWVGL